MFYYGLILLIIFISVVPAIIGAIKSRSKVA